MAVISVCPEVQQLEWFLLGQLEEPDLETLQQHLAGCPACRARTAALEVQDTLVKALPALSPLAPPPENSVVNHLIDRLQRLPREQGASLSGAADEGTAREGADGNEELGPIVERPPLPSPQVGRYEIEEEIARGGMGAVWQARDTTFQRTVALKVLLPSRQKRPELKQRFLEEAQVLGRLQHPGIPPVHDLGELADGRPFFAMKLIQGRTLGQLLRERSAPAQEMPRFLAIFEQVCQTVAYAHSRGVLHRDLKPSNVMVGSFGEVQVMDWGLAPRRDAGRDGAGHARVHGAGAGPRGD
jgi:tRNA A-37 threonylcarbamoyl transferase component Bud32